MHKWITLTTRYGASSRNPTRIQLEAALRELFGLEDKEHPDCWIECGSDDKPLHTLTFFSSGRGIYTKYSDADMREELDTRELVANTVAVALKFWESLINERYEEL